MYVLDTCVVSELRKTTSGRVDSHVARWASTHPFTHSWLSAITVKELEYGVLVVERRDPSAAVALREWCDGVCAQFAERILPVDDRVARRAATLHVPDPASEADAYIAATALVRGLTIVTRNTADFARFEGVTLVNPWLE